MKHPSLLPKRVIRISLAVAAAAWCALVVLAVRTEGGDAFGARVVAVGFPFGYCGWLAILWLVGDMALSLDRSFTAGPFKDLQLKLARGPMVWFCNATAIILPAAVLIVAILGIIGLLPRALIPQNAVSNTP